MCSPHGPLYKMVAEDMDTQKIGYAEKKWLHAEEMDTRAYRCGKKCFCVDFRICFRAPWSVYALVPVLSYLNCVCGVTSNTDRILQTILNRASFLLYGNSGRRLLRLQGFN